MRFEKQAAQGDVLITRIDELPKGLFPFTPVDGQYIVGHSETGHHHTIAAESVDAFQYGNDFRLFLVVNNPTVLKHNRSYDTHAPIEISPGVYRIDRQREYTPEGFRRAAD